MKILRFSLLIILIFFTLGGVFLFWTYRELQTPIAHDNATKYINIPRGSPPDDIIHILSTAGVIRREWPLATYIKLKGIAPRLKAGDYRFPTPISPLGVLRKLEEGEQRMGRFTVIEGWTRWDIANSMSHLPEINLTNPEAALALMDDVSSIRDLDPQATTLEGYLFPDTYNFPPNTSATEMLNLMTKRFRQQWKPDWTERTRSLGMNAREVVTVASLIETEAKLNEDRPLIASVIYNRLQKRIPLGIDSTAIYASKLAGKWRNDGKVYKSDIERKSPYNTRLQAGLPPGPIASPGLSSLEAALNPAQTDYLYYVRDPSRNDGKHNFYSNEGDFQRGVQALREWERQNK
jgi:UPF0755 protein